MLGRAKIESGDSHSVLIQDIQRNESAVKSIEKDMKAIKKRSASWQTSRPLFETSSADELSDKNTTLGRLAAKAGVWKAEAITTKASVG